MTNRIDRQLFIDRVRSRVGQGYIYGAYFDRIISEEYIQQKAKQYPRQYTDKYISQSRKWIGVLAGDCVGLIKAAYWERLDGKVIYKYLDRADLSANGMYQAANVKGLISQMPDVAGLAVHYPGHIGVYVGNGEVVESRGVDYGVVVTRLKDRPWENWLEVPYVDYSDVDEVEMPMDRIYQGVRSGLLATGLWQTILVALGYDLGNYGADGNGIDCSFGPKTGSQTIQFKKDHGIRYSSDNATVVDSGVLSVALAALKKKIEDGGSSSELKVAQEKIRELEGDLKLLADASRILQKY